MIKRDTLFFFAPVFYLMLGISTCIVSACFAEPTPRGIAGPSGSSMVCVFYFMLHLILWCFVGLITLILYYFRYRGSQVSDDYDQLKLAFGGVIGGGLIILGLIISAEMSEFLVAFSVSVVCNVIPIGLTMMLGLLLTTHHRIRLSSSVDSVEEATVFRPSLH